MGNMEGTVATKHKQSIHFKPLDALNDFVRDVNDDFITISCGFAGIGVASASRAKDRAAARQKSAYILNIQRHHVLILDESIITIADADHFAIILIDRRLDRG